MKKVIILSYLVLIMLSAGISCTKPAANNNNNNSNSTTNVTQSFTGTIDGSSWTATSYTGTVVTGYINIRGTAADGSYIKMSFPQSLAAGTYSVGNTTDRSVSYTCPACMGTYTAGAGSMKLISNADGVVKGSFSGVMMANSNNTNKEFINNNSGSFVVKYQ